MPEWLLTNDNYIPEKNGNKFIDKSVYSIIGVLSRIRRSTSSKHAKININSSVAVMITIIIIFLLSMSRSYFFISVVATSILVLLGFLESRKIWSVLKAGFIACILTLTVLIPSMIMGNFNNSLLIVFKTTISVSAVKVLTNAVSWNDITGTLRLFFAPDIFIFIIDITIKYIVILGEFTVEMLYSLKLRSVGRNTDKRNSLFGIIGTMFIKSKGMAEEMYGAMECRGFTGEYKIYRKTKMKLFDFAFILYAVIIILIYMYC